MGCPARFATGWTRREGWVMRRTATITSTARAGARTRRLTASLILVACTRDPSPKTVVTGSAAPLPPTPAAIPAAVRGAEDGQWTWAAKDYANSRYSALDQIDTTNVRTLRVAWTFSTGVL